MGPRAGLDVVERRKTWTLSGIEPTELSRLVIERDAKKLKFTYSICIVFFK
jgi:hypothetical protein